MSKRKKKTETVKSSPLTDKGYSVRIDPGLMGQRVYGYGRSPLDAALEAEDAALAQELKSTRVEGILLKNKTKVAKLQQEMDKIEKESEKIDSDDQYSPKINVAMAQQLANLPDDQRARVIETYAMLMSARTQGKGDSMLPLLIGFSKSNPGSTQSDMVTYAKAMSDQFRTGIDAMKAVMPQKDKASNPMEFMKIMKDLVIEGVRNPLLQAIEKSQPQPGVFEQILTNPDLYSRAKEIGMFGGNEPRTGSTHIDLEIEKLKGERQLSMKKMDLEWRKDSLERDARDRRSDDLIALVAPISALLAGPVAQKMQQLGEQQGAAHIPPSVTPPVAPPTGTTIIVRCTCGYEGPMSFPGPPPPIIKCPSCSLDLNVNPPATA